MTAARHRSQREPSQPDGGDAPDVGPVIPKRPGHPRVRLAPGTQVTMVIRGVVRAGVVQLYEPEHTLCHDTFPVMFAYSGQWRMLNADDVTVTGPKEAP